MNNARRKAVDALTGDIQSLKELADSLKTRLEEIQGEEQDYYDNMPESFQNGDKGEKAQSALDLFDQASCLFDNIETEIDEIIEQLNEAKGE